MKEENTIHVYGARVHNLKNVEISIPRNKLVVFTGLSGSGKSSLAFDTIYAEGQRRYIDTFSSYVKQFIGGLERPDVDKIDGLSPVISIEQKTVSKSPRSTVGTITELYDFFRLLFARASTAYSFQSGEAMVKYGDTEISKLILSHFKNEKIYVLAPKVKGRKGHYKELFEQILRNGYTKVRIDGSITDIRAGMKLDRYKIHDIEVVIDRLEANENVEKRLYESVVTAMKIGEGNILIASAENENIRYYSRSLMCPTTGISYPEPEPNLFSFNSPYGACQNCNGLGLVSELDISKIIPDQEKNIKQGAIIPIGEYKQNWFFDKIDKLVQHYGYSLTTPINKFDEKVLNILLYGNEDMEFSSIEEEFKFEGIASYLLRSKDDGNAAMQRWAQSFTNMITCADCDGSRIKKEARHFKIGSKHIGEISSMQLDDLAQWVEQINDFLNSDQQHIAKEIIKEIRERLSFILNVGLDYLTLNRPSKSLSGGEAQRIRLATQIGTQLINVLYILDEPSIGLHQRDNSKLINSLKKLRDAGNSVLVVEHDKEMMENADFIVEIGPRAGRFGGKIVAAGTYNDYIGFDTETTLFLNGKKEIPIPKIRRIGNGLFLNLVKASGHNLKNVNLKIPLGTLTCITGVSGSGKSSLINQTLFPALQAHFHNGLKKPLPYKELKGLENLDKVIEIDQSPIGRTPRSNPVTYTKVFDDIRNLFATLPESQIRGYKPGRFSFNVSGGKCEVCNGGGMRIIEMNFLPDVYVECESCNGKRYNRETLEIKYKGKSISDVLNLTIEESLPFFEAIPKIHRVLKTLNDVGLGYVTLGQSATTLSGGEAQRIKLASELSRKGTGKTIYLLDEPSTGLHFEDIRLLLDVLQKLVNEGNTVVLIEHNLDLIKVADHIIDIGPDAGEKGGEICFQGTPEEMIKQKKSSSHTAKYLSHELGGK
ncbi:MAG: excinuclease ABC subunit UvrA [Bacteroidetes bacterium]|nr:excinuclease ABC subunit UvrA [Bacteroidota bacterium]